MFYISTRDESIKRSAAEAILMGLADDGGLYVPSDLASAAFPMDKLLGLTEKEISATVDRSTVRMSVVVLWRTATVLPS